MRSYLVTLTLETGQTLYRRCVAASRAAALAIGRKQARREGLASGIAYRAKRWRLGQPV